MTAETATIDLVPNQPKTPMHSFRCDDELWEAGKAAAARQGTTLAAVLRDAIRELVEADPQTDGPCPNCGKGTVSSAHFDGRVFGCEAQR